ncbi:Aste57867_17882 [Aphanomyces stellatus]|uniref:Aste57867_17882 protein n=1 Tax=Aphanomyces stellatus TaxID=120398 RepID=A0A485L9J5_9STRA|nr:hypothetical protein As57867_017821 [Aphanomyces stellatus]VFT94625.1 Aste57867_17882 [Aphanomyces stellatus]
MTASTKKRYTEDEDIMLLRQVAVDMPFQAPRGLVMEAWTAVAHALSSFLEFGREDVDGKNDHHRFHLILENHRKANTQSKRASGASEDKATLVGRPSCCI